MDYEAIANKIEELIKSDIQAKGLIKTGAMYKSITIIFEIYCEYLDSIFT